MPRTYNKSTHKCKTCDESNPEKFRDKRKSICNKCYNKAQRKRQAKNMPPPTMTPEEQEVFANTPAVNMFSAELRMKYE